MDTISEFLSRNGIAESDIILDGLVKTIDTDSFKGWYRGSDLGLGRRSLTIENWKTRNREFFLEGVDLKNPEHKAKIQELAKEFEAEKLRLQLENKKMAKKHFGHMKHVADTPKYLLNKGITQTFGAMVVESDAIGFDLVITLRDSLGELWNYQTIQENGFKTFVPGAKVEGLWFELNSPESGLHGDVPIFIAEGFATACSVQMAMPHSRVICAFGAGNLLAVAENIRNRHIDAKIIIAGDDDHKVDGNPGREKAEATANAIHGTAVFPVFMKVRAHGDTDFNDLMQRYDLQTVTHQLEGAVAEARTPDKEWLTHFTEARRLEKSPKKIDQKKAESHQKIADGFVSTAPYVNGLAPMKMEVSKTGGVRFPPQEEIAEKLFDYYKERAVINDGAVFLYKDNYWFECTPYEEAKMIQQINILCERLATDTQMKQVFNIFKRKLLKPSRNLFEPVTTMANFLNGTLHLVRKATTWKLEFREHNRLDFCTNIIPIEYDVSRTAKNSEFDAMIERVLGSETDDDKEKIRALKQMYGACVMPNFARIFLLHGQGGTGKSSLIIPAIKLLGDQNIASVEPHEFDGFNMETMVGKLANIVLDINTKDALKDHQLKKIEDTTVKVRIRRKGRVDISGYLPRIHIFGGNDIPPTTDQGSGAHERRWTLIRTDKFAPTGNYSKTFSTDVFEANPKGVLNFALEGLDDLLAHNGNFTNPESGKRDLEEALAEPQVVLNFVKEIMAREVVTIVPDPKGRVLKRDVYPKFKEWMDEQMDRRASLGKIKFLRLFEKHASSRVICSLEIGAEFAPGGLRLIKSEDSFWYGGLRLVNDGVKGGH